MPQCVHIEAFFFHNDSIYAIISELRAMACVLSILIQKIT
jgi:hypothetical protein